ncbi:hypothetical protein WQE_16064 [Paraburkholderia hospita]|uniref:Uncharacterized protein n=1 Tax=Paraburkholderia hospita TaxID=169430 RepID=A0ABN0FMJ7_9BURK|nr:hypothetical protein [Paraburkholderia hospita]EIN00008.1 hypothetical protein WQE_16064 [Paraburkholderia hospita]OUL87795.1 hypothetical protein CA602_12630 [Paraburkholderia hospita]
MHIEHTIADPLRLAALYQAGRGVQWNSYREAAAKLTTQFNMNIGFARIREAVAVSELPPEILSIFSGAGLVNRTARELLKAAKTKGVSTLVARARKVNPSGMSRADLTALLCGTPFGGPLLHKPLLLAEMYGDGLKEGRWTSPKEGAKSLGISLRNLTRVISIASLPSELLALFPDVGGELGERLVHLTKIRGDETMKALAIEASRISPRLSQEELIGHFVGLARNKAKVSLRNSGGNLIVEYNLGPVDKEAASKISLMAQMLNAGQPLRRK